jgi:hypothetical protein
MNIHGNRGSKRIVQLVIALAAGVVLACGLPATAQAASYRAMYRLYNPNSGEHFYTASKAEAKNVVEAGWRWEGIGWVAPSDGAPVYRLYSGTDHHYTADAGEKDWLITQGWRYEGVGWFTADEASGLPLYRQFNPNVDPTAKRNNSGSHNYTLNKAENDYLVSVGWRAEGIGWYGADAPAPAMEDGGMWVSTAAWTGSRKELYWIGADGALAKSRVIDPSANAADAAAGRRAYATETGAVVRGKYATSDGHVILATQDGVLEASTGWKETSSYDSDGSHLYYLENLGNGLVGAKTGDFTVNGKKYHGIPGKGYVVRNGTWLDDATGIAYTADANGVITKTEQVDYGTQIANLAAALAGTATPGDRSADIRVSSVYEKSTRAEVQDYIKVHDMTLGAWGGNMAYASCTQAVSTVLAATVDPDIASGKCKGNSGPPAMLAYLANNGLYQEVTSGPLKPGDILADSTHDAIYTGTQIAQRYFPGTTAYIYEASYSRRAYPALHLYGDPSNVKSYSGMKVYRVTGKATPKLGTSFIDYSFALR